MTTHIVLLVLITLLGMVAYSRRIDIRNKNKFFVTAAMIMVFFIQALRKDTVGIDTATYTLWFTRINSGVFPRWEFLYIWLNKFIGFFTDDPQWLIAAISFIVSFGFGYFILNTADEDIPAFWSVFLFMALNQYFVTMNLLRQACAIAIGINAYTVLYKKLKVFGELNLRDFIKAVAVVLIAVFFHMSGLVCFVLIVPFLIRNLNRKGLVITFLATVVFAILYESVFNIVLRLFPQYMSYAGRESAQALTLTGNNLIFLLIKGICVLLYFTNSGKQETDQKTYRLAFALIISFALTALQTRTRLAVRVAYFFDVFLITAIPDIIRSYVKEGQSRVYTYMALYVIGFAYFIYVMIEGARGCVPYLFFWQ